MNFFKLVEDAEIFAVRDFQTLTSRAYRRITATTGNSALSIGAYIAAIIFLAQERHVDIFEKDKADLLGAGIEKAVLVSLRIKPYFYTVNNYPSNCLLNINLH